MKLLLLLPIAAMVACAQMTEVSGERIRAHVKFLSGDLLEGRAPGSRGGDLATEYIATQFSLLGLKPAGDQGTYFQKFALVGVEPQADAQLSFSPDKGATTSLKWLDEFVGVTYQQRADAQFDAPAVFVGHGIVAPEYQWDDYQGMDVRG